MISDSANFKCTMIVLRDLGERADQKTAEWMYRELHKEIRFLVRKFRGENQFVTVTDNPVLESVVEHN